MPKPQPKGKNQINIAFDSNILDLTFEQIVITKVVNKYVLEGTRFQKILSSIREDRLIEHPVVVEDKVVKGRYILLDGHLRIEALKQLGHTSVPCLLSMDDEAFTYNKHVNHLSPIQEHKMLMLAIKRGVPEEKIAKTLNINVENIMYKRDLLNGICDEVVNMLKDKMVATKVFCILRRMKTCSQIETASLMNNVGIYSLQYAQSILLMTPKNQLLEPDRPKKIKGISDEKITNMERETEYLLRDYKIIEENYGTDVLHLTVAKSYLTALLANGQIEKYLGQYFPDILATLRGIANMSSLGSGQAAV